MVEYIKKTKVFTGVIGMKLNMAKAFDCMEWNFLIKILNSLGLILNGAI